MQRDILYLNIGSFAASVEQHTRLSLKGKLVIVGVPKGNSSGVVFSASREVRKLGIMDGMSIRQAQRICPDAVVLPANHAVYRQVFDEFLDICSKYSPLLEPDTLGCAWMDVSGCGDLFGQPQEIAANISNELMKRLRMILSVGCASNKLLAKIASGLGKKFTRVMPDREKAFLSPMPIIVLDAVNAKIEKRLNDLGISNIGQLAQISEALLVRQFGSVGRVIKRQALGLDFSPVIAAYPTEIIIIEHMCDCPLEEPSHVEPYLRMIVAEAVTKLGRQNSLAGEVTLTMFDESEPGLYLSIPASFKFKKPISSASVMTQTLCKLVNSKMEQGMMIARVRVVFSDLSHGDSHQLCLIENDRNKDRLDRAVDMVKNRFGDDSVCLAASLMPTHRGEFRVMP